MKTAGDVVRALVNDRPMLTQELGLGGRALDEIREHLMAQQVRPDKLPQTGLLDTTVGRVLFNVPLPKPLQFANEIMDKKKLNDFIGVCYELLGSEATAEVADTIKHLGFTYATVSGMTIAVSDITVPPSKQAILEETDSAG